MLFVKTFKGYEDKPMDLDREVNAWITGHAVEVIDIKSVLSHEVGGRARMGDLLYTVVYRSDKPIE